MGDFFFQILWPSQNIWTFKFNDGCETKDSTQYCYCGNKTTKRPCNDFKGELDTNYNVSESPGQNPEGFFSSLLTVVFCFQNCSIMWLRKTFEIRGWRLRICKLFEIHLNNLLGQWKFSIIFETECLFNLFLEVSQIQWIQCDFHVQEAGLPCDTY